MRCRICDRPDVNGRDRRATQLAPADENGGKAAAPRRDKPKRPTPETETGSKPRTRKRTSTYPPGLTETNKKPTRQQQATRENARKSRRPEACTSRSEGLFRLFPLVGVEVARPPFQGGSTGSNPVGATPHKRESERCSRLRKSNKPSPDGVDRHEEYRPRPF